MSSMSSTRILDKAGLERSKPANTAVDSESEFLFSLAMHCRFGLTRAESRIAWGIGIGHSLNAISKSYGISVHTARTQLKSVLAKTGTHRQVQLAILLLEIDGRVSIRPADEAE